MLRRLTDLFRRRPADDQPAAATASRDYPQERADYQSAQMSDEDKAWGAASQQRDKENREQDQAPPVE